MHPRVRSLGRPIARLATVAGLVGLLATGGIGGAFPTAHVGAGFGPQPAVAAGNTCSLGNGIQHVIYIQFDNVHFTRDNPNVPSDLEQMPHLLSFLENNGVFMSNHHTPLISHTSEDMITSLTGVYPNRHGVAVGQNSYQFYKAGSPTSYTSAFTYWTDTIGDGTYNLLSGAPTPAKPTGTNAPAPWVPYTRAGCNVGAFSTADIEMENVSSDISTVYGPNSPQAQEAKTNHNLAVADFEGIAVHCAQGAALCSAANGGVTDALPDEPGGYNGYMGLFGNKYVAPQVSPNGPVTDLDGNPIEDSYGNPGFPGFDPTASQALGYVAAMQEHGVPVTYAYIADAHDNHATGNAYGPGEAGYVAQLKSYDQAFATFFQRLANDGITKDNSLFVVTADENDHFTGRVLNPGCTGATIDNSTNPPTVIPGNYCQYDKTTNLGTPPGPPFGEVATGLQGLLSLEGATGPANDTFTVGNDTAPAVYLQGQPARDSVAARTFEQATGAIKVTNPLTSMNEYLTQGMADPVEMSILHMVTLDPLRTPTFTLFSHPDYYVTGTCKGGYNSSTPVTTTACVLEEPTYAWLHGNVQSGITTTWLGMAGPGIRHLGLNDTVWSDHTDIQPTMLALLGLHDDYTPDGRALAEIMDPNVLPHGIHAHHDTWLALAQVYKQLDAPVGAFGMLTLQASTKALESTSPSDATYTSIENRLQALGAQRDALAQQIAAELNATTFGNAQLDEQRARSQIAQAADLTAQAAVLAQP